MIRNLLAPVLFCLMNPVLSQTIRIHPENPEELAVYFLKRRVTEIRLAGPTVHPGSYELTWMDPLDGSLIRKQEAVALERNLSLDFPEFSDDLVLKIKRINK
jgi:hypothetical protein